MLIVSDPFMHFTAVAYSIKQTDLKYIYKRLLLDGAYAHVRISLSTTTVGGCSFSLLCHPNVRPPNQQHKLSVIILMIFAVLRKVFWRCCLPHYRGVSVNMGFLFPQLLLQIM